MKKAAFIEHLQAGLRGASPRTIDDIVADYEAHFADAMAAGRSEEEVCAALGDPKRLARDLRADAGIRQWEEKRSASSAITVVFAILGLGIIDFLVLLPILIWLIPAAIALYIVFLGLFVGGIAVFVGSLLGLMDIAPRFAAALAGLGLSAAALAFGALHTLVCIGLVNALVWFGKLHVKVIKPVADREEAP